MISKSRTMHQTQDFRDFVQPFQIEAPGLRGRLVRLGPAVEEMLANHDYPASVAGMLAEASAMAAVLASGLKFDGIFSLQMQGDGPISLLLVDVKSDGGMRGYARYDSERLRAEIPVSDLTLPRLLGAGHMAFTIDQGPNADRYQGITALEGATLSDCAHAYFRQSEQLETAIGLYTSDMTSTSADRRAAALMIQRLPSSGIEDPDAEDDWRRAVIMMSTATPSELLEPMLSASDILYRLFHEDGVRVYHQKPLRHDCRCSRQKVERTLRSFPRSEVMAMIENDLLTVNCEFCKSSYLFNESDLDKLWA